MPFEDRPNTMNWSELWMNGDPLKSRWVDEEHGRITTIGSLEIEDHRVTPEKFEEVERRQEELSAKVADLDSQLEAMRKANKVLMSLIKEISNDKRLTPACVPLFEFLDEFEKGHAR